MNIEDYRKKKWQECCKITKIDASVPSSVPYCSWFNLGFEAAKEYYTTSRKKEE